MSANNASCSSGAVDNTTSGCGRECSTSAQLSINYDQPELTVVALSLLLVVVGTMLCNLLVGVALLRFRTLRNVSNLLIGNLALSDFLLSVAVLPVSAVNECLGHWVFGRTACNVWLLVDVFFCTASIWNLCIIAFDRFTATFFPLWYRGEGRANWHHAFAYATIVWVIAAAACLPALINWHDLPVNYVTDRVEATSQVNDTMDSCPGRVVYRCVLFRSPSYVLYSASVSFFVPCLVTLFLYISILTELRRRRSKAEALKRRYSDRHQLRQHCAPTPAADESPAAGRWNRDRVATPADDKRATAMTSAVVTWMVQDVNNDETTCIPSADVVDDQHSSNDSSPTSPSRPLSRQSQNGLTAPADDDDVILAPAPPSDVISDMQHLNELTPRDGLLAVSNSSAAIPADTECSVAETFIHRFSCSSVR